MPAAACVLVLIFLRPVSCCRSPTLQMAGTAHVITGVILVAVLAFRIAVLAPKNVWWFELSASGAGTVAHVSLFESCVDIPTTECSKNLDNLDDFEDTDARRIKIAIAGGILAALFTGFALIGTLKRHKHSVLILGFLALVFGAMGLGAAAEFYKDYDTHGLDKKLASGSILAIVALVLNFFGLITAFCMGRSQYENMA
eukprot:m.69946 g.69946  ORF g.69946 m.69946 type:complete len:199 (-) comp50089_c0_seq1:92-688(-)